MFNFVLLFFFSDWCPGICLLLLNILQDAHEAEIQSLNFSFTGLKDLNCENASSSEFLLASGGKGGAIHVYDVKRC